MRRIATALVVAAAACSSTTAAPDGAPPADAAATDAAAADAAPDAAIADAAPRADAAVTPACAAFDSPSATLSGYPATWVGTIPAAGVLDVSACAVEDSLFGLDFAGGERVVRLVGLTAGAPYRVKLSPMFDGGFYVATGCSGEAGPTPGECVLAVDRLIGPQTELGAFAAPASGEAFVVVDTFLDGPPPVSLFTLEVAAVACATDFDCADPAAPVCDAGVCVAGPAACTTDDADGDDGPAAATPIIDGASATVCAANSEADWFRVEVAELARLRVELAWTDAADNLDVYVYDGAGALLGQSWWLRPEVVELTHLAPGNYYVRVEQFAPAGDLAGTPYAIAVAVTSETACGSPADCAASFTSQWFRPACAAAGACSFVDGGGAVAVGEPCDGDDDCAAGAAACAPHAFVRGADQRSVCTIGCASDADCAAMPGGTFRCSSGLAIDLCLAACASDDECPAVPATPPSDGKPWARMQCSAGRCEL